MPELNNPGPRTLRLSHFTIERAPDAVIWIGSDAEIHRINEAGCSLLGYSRDELVGRKIFDFSAQDNEHKFRKRWEQTKTKKTWRYEWAFQTKSGRSVPVEITRNYIEFDGKEYSCSFVRDITERKQAERALKNALKEVETLKNRLTEENLYLKHEIKLTHNFEEIIGSSDAIKGVLAKAEQVAATDCTVLLTGETGTGKELVARAIHYISRRRDRTLVKVNCAALPAALIESELFGHEKGAFTGAFERRTGRFELAHNGTIFLDEIGDLPLEIQVKLLRVLQNGEFERLGSPHTIATDVRIIAATNRDLEQSVKQGTFREDLFYRLNVFPIPLPSLRDRKEDIPALVSYFLEKYCHRIGRTIDSIPGPVMKSLCGYRWPGNIRELENIIERAVIMNTGPVLRAGDWLPHFTGREETSLHLDDLERRHIEKVLESTHWQVSGKNGAAALLGINPNTLVSRMKKFNIRRPV
ncbi:sigma 54-interacting transcriptional regulator [bacterium]|nr:sigma 54-interacting transcriptional regulator [bacterium]